VLAAPLGEIDRHAATIAAQRDRARRCLGTVLAAARADLGHTRARVLALSPAATLDRGYAVVQTPAGAVVRTPGDVAAGAALRIRVAAGEFAAVRS
jgi:exodeoxyribonuclease VII large subunit